MESKIEPAVFRIERSFGQFRGADRIVLDPDNPALFTLCRALPKETAARDVLHQWAAGTVSLAHADCPEENVRYILRAFAGLPPMTSPPKSGRRKLHLIR